MGSNSNLSISKIKQAIDRKSIKSKYYWFFKKKKKKKKKSPNPQLNATKKLWNCKIVVDNSELVLC